MATKYSREEEYIINESPEISVGEVIGWSNHITRFFPAFSSKNYRRYFYGNVVSLIGTWLQIVAQGWLVLQLTNSALLVGIVAAASTLPTLFITPFGGVIVDRVPKKKILICTQISEMILAFTLGLLTIFQIINIYEIIILSFILGIVTAIDSPARQALVTELVDKEHLSSAIALNAGAYNGARVIGPSAAGLLIAWIGVGSAFIINGLSFFAVIIALLYIHVKEIIPTEHPHPIEAIKLGVSYSWKHPIIRTLLVFTAIVSIFGWSYMTIMPVVAQEVFHTGASGLGYLFAASGIGAVTATIAISALSKRVSSQIFILGGNTVFALALLGFSYTVHMWAAYIFLFFVGFGLLSQFSMMNAVIQRLVEDRYRGRVLSIYIIMFLGLAPLGNFQIGYLAEHFGSPMAIRIGALIVLVTGGLLILARKKIQSAYEVYKQEKEI